MCWSWKFCQRGSNFVNVFVVFLEGRGSKLIPLWASHHQPASETPFRWRANDGPTINAGLVALSFFRGSGSVLLRNPIFLWFFKGVRTPCPPPPPPLWIRSCLVLCLKTSFFRGLQCFVTQTLCGLANSHRCEVTPENMKVTWCLLFCLLLCFLKNQNNLSETVK